MKWSLIGCGGAIAIFVVALVIGYALVGRAVQQERDNLVARYKSQGYREIQGNHEGRINITDPIKGKTVLNANWISVHADSDSDLAIIGIDCSLDSTVNGNLFFHIGQLRIGPDGAVLGNLEVDCRKVIVDGYIQGQIKGHHSYLEDANRKDKFSPK